VPSARQTLPVVYVHQSFDLCLSFTSLCYVPPNCNGLTNLLLQDASDIEACTSCSFPSTTHLVYTRTCFYCGVFFVNPCLSKSTSLSTSFEHLACRICLPFSLTFWAAWDSRALPSNGPFQPDSLFCGFSMALKS